MTHPLRLLAFILGLIIVLGTAASVFTTLIVPRYSSSRLLRGIARFLAKSSRPLIKRAPTYAAKDRFMAVIGPMAMILLFISWLVAILIGFGLMTWWLGDTTFGHAFTIAGSSVFTLGIATGHRAGGDVIEVVAAGAGLLIIALEIAYLPTLYAAFSARETEVTLLATRAGIPGWGPEVLARSHWFHTMSELPDLYLSWERWAANVAESHTNYPSLMWFRSPVPQRSWLTALTAMMDAAALHDAASPGSAPRQARLCLQMGMNCVRALAQALGIEYDADPLPTTNIRLTREEFMEGFARLEAVGFPSERTAEETWRHFAGWRVNYEGIVDALTLVIMPPPAPWFLPRPELGPVPKPRVLDRTPDDPTALANPE